METKSTILFMFLLQATTNLVNLSIAKPPDVQNIFRCRPTGKYKSNTYLNNINSALNTVATNIAAKKGFFHTTAGKFDQVHAVGLCPPYLKPDACSLCIKNSIKWLLSNCPDDKEAYVWTGKCMLRYSDRKIVGVLDNWDVAIDTSPTSVPKGAEMEKALTDLVGKLKKQAAGGSAVEKFAYGSLKYASGVPVNTVHVAVQCTPDLSKEDCSKCLSAGPFVKLHACCSGKKSGRLCGPNCYVRFEHEKFNE